eukprot:3831668-Pyramimonas_sp.AAC.1
MCTLPLLLFGLNLLLDDGATGPADRGAGGAARPLCDEHGTRDHAGVRGLRAHAVRRVALGNTGGGLSPHKGAVRAAQRGGDHAARRVNHKSINININSVAPARPRECTESLLLRPAVAPHYSLHVVVGVVATRAAASTE